MKAGMANGWGAGIIFLAGMVWTSAAAAGTPVEKPATAVAEPVTVRIATYNVRNYVITNRLVDGQYLKNWPKPEAEKSALRAVIRAAHPDVLAMEEMGPAPELEELRRDLATEGLEYKYIALVNGPDPDRHVAVLSRLPFAQVHGYANISYKIGSGTDEVKRGMLEVDFVTAGHPWALYVVHLKSRLNEENDPNDPLSAKRREGEAQVMRDMVRQQQPLEAGALVAVVGDFNDTRDSAAVRRFVEVGSKPLLTMVPAADTRGEAWTFTYPHADTYERIDFVLLSPARAPWLKEPGHVMDIPEVNDASDHRMVWAELVFPPAEATAPTAAAKIQ
jgi:endonuclease/exonuclease/phosphatase family metal-dependent hydrolase